MRHLLLFIFALFLSFTVSCSKDEVEGPQGSQGIEGEQGPKGDKGDQGDPGPTAQRFTVSVKADQWSGAHYGNSNSFSYYKIPASAMGGLALSSSDYTVIAYAKQLTGYSELRMLPHSYTAGNAYRITMDMLPRRNEVILYKSTDGVEVQPIPLNERPAEVEFIFFFIKVTTAKQLKGKIDLSDYDQVSRYFDQ